MNRIRNAVIEIIRSHAVYQFEVNTSGKSVEETERQQLHLLKYLVNDLCRPLQTSFVLL